MSNFDKGAHQTKWIPVKSLSVIWSQSQRGLDKARVNKIAAGFDPDLFDDLVVTLPNGHGIYHVIDGQHRRAAIQQLYGENETVPCRVLDVQDPKRAAEIFDKVNTGRKTPSAIEQFRVRTTAGCDTEVHISCILDKLGYQVAWKQGPGTIASVQALISVYKTYGSDVLKEALQTIKATWADDANATASGIIRGYGALIAQHRGHIDFQRLRERMSTMTPGQIIGRARYHSSMTKVGTTESVKHILIETYDSGLRTGKLGG